MEAEQAGPVRERVRRINPYAHPDPTRVRRMFFGRKRELGQLRKIGRASCRERVCHRV